MPELLQPVETTIREFLKMNGKTVNAVALKALMLDVEGTGLTKYLSFTKSIDILQALTNEHQYTTNVRVVRAGTCRT